MKLGPKTDIHILWSRLQMLLFRDELGYQIFPRQL